MNIKIAEIFSQIISKLISKGDLNSLSTLYYASLLTKGINEEIIERYRNKIFSIIKENSKDLNLTEHRLIHIVDDIFHYSKDHINRKLFHTLFLNESLNPNIRNFLQIFPDIIIETEEEIKARLKRKYKNIAVPDFILKNPSKDHIVAIDLVRISGIKGQNYTKKFLKILKRRKDLNLLGISQWVFIIQIGITIQNSYDDAIYYLTELFRNIIPTFFNPKRVYGVVNDLLKNELQKIKKINKNTLKEVIQSIQENIEYLRHIDVKTKTEVLPFYILYYNNIDIRKMREDLKRNQQKFINLIIELFQ